MALLSLPRISLSRALPQNAGRVTVGRVDLSMGPVSISGDRGR